MSLALLFAPARAHTHTHTHTHAHAHANTHHTHARAHTQFCVDLDGPNALDRPAYDAADDTCATGSRKCGGNTTDAEGVFCWPSADPCPITDLLWMSRTAAMTAGCDEILPDMAVDNSTEALCIMRGPLVAAPPGYLSVG